MNRAIISVSPSNRNPRAASSRRMSSTATAFDKGSGRLTERMGLRFAVTFALFAGALFTVYAFPFELFGAREDWLRGYLAAYAHLAGGVLSLFEHGVVIDGTFIQGRYPMQIVRNCDAADVNIVFSSALLAFPGPWRKKALLLSLGLAALVAANVTRICSLYYVGVWAPSWFKLAHEEVWPLVLVAITVGVFLICIRRLQPAEPSEAE
jgi:exosortase/archaeosortase family protein